MTSLEKNILEDSQISLTIEPNKGISEYRKYIEQLHQTIDSGSLANNEAVNKALDGQAYEFLRNSISLEARREVGAFFTSTDLSTKIALEASKFLKDNDIIIDPACGAGSLLIAIAEQLKLEENLEKTLRAWGEKIYGFDLHDEFVSATKMRLALLAAKRCGEDLLNIEYLDHFPNIKKGDALKNIETISKANCILINPPYVSIMSPQNCQWSSGKISSAALFLDLICERDFSETRNSSLAGRVAWSNFEATKQLLK